VEAVALAHAEGIAHRDLKPGNLFLAQTRFGQKIKVLDFGIAKPLQEGERITQLSTRTASGFRPFSPNYGAPEQFWPERFGSTGKWTDVHALGLLLVELVSGRPALQGQGLAELLFAGTNADRPTPRAKGARVGDAFEAVCARALALDPRERYRDASELLQALDGLAQGAPRPARGESEPRRDATGPAEPKRAMAAPAKAAATVPLPAQGTEPAAPGWSPPTVPEPAPQAAAASPAIIPRAPGRAARTRRLWLRIGGAAVLVVGVGGAGVLVAQNLESGGGLAGDASEPHESSPSASAAALSPSASSGADASLPDTSGGAQGGRMVRIPAGTFSMGSNDGDPDEQPVHEVAVPSFEMDVTEVTVAAYQACVEAGACKRAFETVSWQGIKPEQTKLWSQFCNAGRGGRQKHPVNCVDWEQAKTYCEWAGKRLPSEEEWEYAARGTDGRRFPWGNQPPGPSRVNACGTECVQMLKSKGVTWSAMYQASDGYADTAPVASFPPGRSPFGVHDMAGNVWEWTATKYCDSYGTSKKCTKARVNRGGSWDYGDPSNVRAPNRYRHDPASRYSVLGFRCAR
jgi:formylglycine-generating enzyme required for sulfatase activity